MNVNMSSSSSTSASSSGENPKAKRVTGLRAIRKFFGRSLGSVPVQECLYDLNTEHLVKCLSLRAQNNIISAQLQHKPIGKIPEGVTDPKVMEEEYGFVQKGPHPH